MVNLGKLIIDLNLIVLIFLLVASGLYAIYALLVYKQTRIINDTIKTPAASLLNAVALLHLLFALGVFVATAAALFLK